MHFFFHANQFSTKNNLDCVRRTIRPQNLDNYSQLFNFDPPPQIQKNIHNDKSTDRSTDRAAN